MPRSYYHLSTVLRDELFAQARACAPAECCGLLVGDCERINGRTGWRIAEIHPSRNLADDLVHGYEIDARTHLRVQREARERGRSVVGFYHSHPGGSSRPSTHDAARAWPGHIYVILAPAADEPLGAWIWLTDGACVRLEPAIDL